MIIRKLRLQRGWSQDQLSQMTGLSIRTIQRIERGQKPSLESQKSLAAVFEINLTELQVEQDMSNEITISDEEQKAIDEVRAIKDFYSHLSTYVFTIVLLFILNYMTSPDYIWTWWVVLGWGIGIVSHGLSTFEIINFFGPEWEKKQIEKRLGKKL
jgi:Predicted transcription factor, homolog of eukaryotic MBF1